MTAVPSSVIATSFPNQYYEDHEVYVDDLSTLMRMEYDRLSTQTVAMQDCEFGTLAVGSESIPKSAGGSSRQWSMERGSLH